MYRLQGIKRTRATSQSCTRLLNSFLKDFFWKVFLWASQAFNESDSKDTGNEEAEEGNDTQQRAAAGMEDNSLCMWGSCCTH